MSTKDRAIGVRHPSVVMRKTRRIVTSSHAMPGDIVEYECADGTRGAGNAGEEIWRGDFVYFRDLDGRLCRHNPALPGDIVEDECADNAGEEIWRGATFIGSPVYKSAFPGTWPSIPVGQAECTECGGSGTKCEVQTMKTLVEYRCSRCKSRFARRQG